LPYNKDINTKLKVHVTKKYHEKAVALLLQLLLIGVRRDALLVDVVRPVVNDVVPGHFSVKLLAIILNMSVIHEKVLSSRG